MSDARDRMIADFGRKVSAQLEQLLQREIDLARHVFDAAEITEMVLKITVGMNLAAILVAIQAKNDKISAEELFDLAASSLHKMVLARKAGLADVLELVGKRRAGASR